VDVGQFLRSHDMAISNNMRFTVLERDGFMCQYCGKKAPEANIEVDHVTPVSAGGEDIIDNLVAACVECNSGKAGKVISKPVTNKAIKKRLKHLEERRDILTKCSDCERDIMLQLESSAWKLAKHWAIPRSELIQNEDGTVSVATATLSHMRGILARVDFATALDCINIALARHRRSHESTAFKYLYGIIRNKENLLGDTNA
jgi:hypothetical protein